MGVFKCGATHFDETAMHAKAQASNRMAKANRASHGPRVSPHSQAKARVEKIQRKSKGTKNANQGVKGVHKSRTSKTGLSGLENSKSEAGSETQESGHVCTTDTSWNESWNCDEWNDGWSFDEWNDDGGSVGWHEGWEQTYDTSASSFSLESSEWAKMNLDTRDSLECTTFCAVLQRSRAKDGKISTSDTMVDT